MDTTRDGNGSVSAFWSILKSTFGSAGVSGGSGQRDVEYREVEDREEGKTREESFPKDRAAPKVASVYFSPSLAGINIADAVSAVRSSPQQAGSRQEVVRPLKKIFFPKTWQRFKCFRLPSELFRRP